MLIIGHTYIFFEQMSSQIPHSFLNWVICLFILSSNLYVLCIFILDIRSFSDVWFADVFSHSVGFLFILLTVSFDTQKFSIWIKSNLSFFFFFFTGVGFHFLLQGIFWTQGSNLRLLHWPVGSLPRSHQGSPVCLFCLAMLCCLPDLSSLTRGWTQALSS